MKTENKSKAGRLAFFRNLYENAKNRYADTAEHLDRHMRQYRGSDEIDNSQERACAVRNITYELIESQVSSDIPLPKVDAAWYSEKRDRCAKSIERLCASVRDRLSFEEMNDLDERYTYIYGGSVWLVEWDSGAGDGGDVQVHCLSPKHFIPQPSLASVDDMEYCFLRFSTTRGELCRRYGISEADAELAQCECESEDSRSAEDTVTLILCFYRGEDGEVGQFVFSGDLTLADEPDYYKRKKQICRRCGKETVFCSCEKCTPVTVNDDEEVLSETICRKDGGRIVATLPPSLAAAGGGTRIGYYTPKSFPIVIRKNTSAEGEILGQSDCEYIRPEQQAINKIESRILQKLVRAGITPIVPEDASITLNNSVFGQLIKMKPGESAAQYGKVDTTPDVSQDIAEAERLYDHAKRILGISDAYQGIDSYRGESGYARQLRISQASGRLESKRKMKYTAYADLDRLIFEHYLAFADEPRTLSYKDGYGRIHDEEFSRYDFLTFDLKSGKYVYDDDFLFSVDLNGGAEYQREALWERNLENLRSGALGDPSAPMTLLRYWQCQERAHYPFARENVEFFSELIREGGSTDVPYREE